MPKTEMEFRVCADPDALVAYLTVPEAVGKHLPFVERTDEKGHWIIKDQHSKITQTKTLAPELTVNSNGSIEWKAKGENLTLTLKAKVEPDKNISTVRGELTMDIGGVLGVVLAPIISLNIRNQLESFARSLREEFDDPTLPKSGCHNCPICGP